MRNNGAISGKEIELRDDQIIISRTDNQGRIVYVNADFVEISGFSEEELSGQQHNIVRHPDMPPEVFADLWQDLKARRPWIGLIKNRCKNGDAYWVEAHVSPILDMDNISGYMSMRRKPTRAQIRAAEQTYAALRTQPDNDLVFEHGIAKPRKAWGSLRNKFKNAPLAIKFFLISLVVAALALGLTAYFLTSDLSRTLDDNARLQLTHDVSLLSATVSARVEGARIEATEYGKALSKRIYDAAGGPQKISRQSLEAVVARASAFQSNPTDAFLSDLRGVGSIFILTPEGFQRRMTGLIDQQGASAVGSYLATNHPAYPLLTAGQAYTGPSRLFGHQYISRYTPILDGQGAVIGATAVAIDLADHLNTLKKQMRSVQLGTTGYYYILDTTPGPDYGTVILHPYLEGGNVVDVHVDTEHTLVGEMVKRGAGEISYFWKNEAAGETVARKKLVIFETLDDPKWVVAGGSPVDEFTALSDHIAWLVFVGGLGMIAVMFAIIQFLIRKLVLKPLTTQILPAFQAISNGKFDTRLNVRGNDEMARTIQGLESLRNRLAFDNERERTLSAMREQARQEAESLARARAEFLANMSHEIRTPLNAVIGLAYLLLQNKLGERETEYVKRIEGAGKLLLAIVNDILDFSKIDAGKMQLEEAPFRLDDLLDNLSNLVRNRVQEKNLVLAYVVAPDTPQDLCGDSLRLSQVLINLVSNAIKFTAEGSITVFINMASRNGTQVELEFRVQDTGIGMSATQSANLFQAFSQADSSVTRKFGGSGLGLVISQRLVEMMHGSISVDSAPEVGSTFSFRIWLGIDQEKSQPAQNIGYEILVVDDNSLARSVLASLLKKHGCTVHTAESGEAALLAIIEPDAPAFDCIMLDLNMPGMDGLALASRIRAERGQSTKLVMVTSANVHATQYRHALGDFDAIIEKPVTAARIGEVLHQLSNPEPAANTPPPVQQAPLAGLHILVAEDVPTNQLIMRDLLESLGATVDMADNGILVQQQLATAGGKVDLILMDVQMPEMDGMEATRRIRAGQVQADIPIIALTAHALEEERQRTIEAGMNDFLTKPIEPARLIAVIQRWRPVRSGGKTAAPAKSTASPGQIPDIPGLDVEDGLRRMLNRLPLYEKVLRDFHTRFTGEGTRIRSALSADEIEPARRYAHSLKGTSGMISATTLATLAAELEQAIMSGSPEREHCLERCENELERVLAGIKATFAIGEP